MYPVSSGCPEVGFYRGRGPVEVCRMLVDARSIICDSRCLSKPASGLPDVGSLGGRVPTVCESPGRLLPWSISVTWLILTVVISFYQRLSHACLSMNASYCETTNGSLNQL